jgi:hypothetical protein
VRHICIYQLTLLEEYCQAGVPHAEKLINPRASAYSLVCSIAKVDSRSVGMMSMDGRRCDITVIHRHACLENEAECAS